MFKLKHILQKVYFVTCFPCDINFYIWILCKLCFGIVVHSVYIMLSELCGREDRTNSSFLFLLFVDISTKSYNIFLGKLKLDSKLFFFGTCLCHFSSSFLCLFFMYINIFWPFCNLILLQSFDWWQEKLQPFCVRVSLA